jgi:hypothetical protein
MRHYDVFNGDADGICALHQLRLFHPVESEPIAGLKRDIALLQYVPAVEGDLVTVLDISLDRNREALEALLARGVIVHYFDHHHAGTLPPNPLLTAMIDTAPETCTSALVDRNLGGRFRPWAVVGAFGDAMPRLAARLAEGLELPARGLARLRTLGEALNYNAYGEEPADVLVAPVDLYRVVSRYADPFELLEREPVIARLSEERAHDLRHACGVPPAYASADADAWVLPDEPWSRRVSGTFANRLALAEPHRAHAVLTPSSRGGFTVSVRSPERADAIAASDFCRRYAGGGRATAAGIDHLDARAVDEFIDAFGRAWRRRA